MLKVPTEHGSARQAHLLEQYKLAVDLRERANVRRQTASSWLLVLNAALLTFCLSRSGSVKPDLWSNPAWPGLLMAAAWFQLLRSYGVQDTIKAEIITKLEVHLPARPFGDEEDRLRKARFGRVIEDELRVAIALLILWAILVATGTNW